MSRILFLIRVYPGIGGIESVTDNLIHELAQDNEIFVLTYPLSHTSYDRSVISGYHLFPSETDTEANIAFYNEIVRAERIEYVINQGIFSFFSDIVFNPGRDESVKVISVLHAMPGYEARDYWLQKGLLKKNWFGRKVHSVKKYFKCGRGYKRHLARMRDTFRKAVYQGYKVVLLADGYVDEFVRLYELDDARDKICSIPNPLSASFSMLPEPDYSKKEKLAVFVGRLAPEKDLFTMLRAWSLIEPVLPDWHLAIVGSGPLEDELRKKASNMKRVSFAGYERNPGIYYEKASMVFLTSEYEGFGMCLSEAERYGAIPVTYFISEGVYSVVAGAGVVVEERTPEAFAAEVCKLAEDKTMLERLARASYQKSEEYCISHIANRWRDLMSL